MTASKSIEDWTVLAHLLRPQGRKGEVLAELLTDFPERFADRPDVFLARPASDGAHHILRMAMITGYWLPVGRNHGRVVLTLEGIGSIESAEALAGLDVVIAAEARIELGDDTEYISDLVGCEVYDRDRLVGQVTGVDFAMSPDGNRRLADAAPLLTVQPSSGEEVLIPYVQQFLLSVRVEEKRIDMTLPEGLIELNRRAVE